MFHAASLKGLNRQCLSEKATSELKEKISLLIVFDIFLVKTALKVLTNEKRSGLKEVAFDRSPFNPACTKKFVFEFGPIFLCVAALDP
jgi:hypothetical protein